MKPKYIIDVTQLVHWQGMITGIPRVMQELSNRFAEDGNAQFVSWVKERQELCFVDFEATFQNKKLGRGGVVYISSRSSESADALVSVGSAAHYKTRAKHFVKRAVRKLGVEHAGIVEK